MYKTVELYKKWKDNPNNGEVFTSEILADEIINKIPEYIWENPNSLFLDPCAGRGTFLIGIVKRLVKRYNYNINDAFKRVYGFDIRIKYINYLNRLGFKNINFEDFMKNNMDKKFDVIIGNPPYQANTKTVKDEKNKQGGLWWKIMYKSLGLLNENGYLTMVTPTSFFSAGGYGTNLHKISKIREHGFKIDNVWSNVDEYFNVGIKISVISVTKKNNNNVNIIDKNENFELDYSFPLPFDLNQMTHSITKKCVNIENMWPFSEKDNSKENDAVIKINGGRFKIYDKMYIGMNSGTKHKAQTMIIPSSHIDFYKSIFNSKLFKFMFKVYGGENGQSSTGILKRLPRLPINKIWSDNEIFLYFKLTENEIKYIESYVL